MADTTAAGVASVTLDGAGITVQDAIQQCSAAFTKQGLVFGHGTDNAWDEATQNA